GKGRVSRSPVGLKLKAGDGQLGRIEDGVDVADEVVGRLEGQQGEELPVAEGERAEAPVERVGYQRDARGRAEVAQGVRRDAVPADLQWPRHTVAQIGLTDNVGIEELHQGFD